MQTFDKIHSKFVGKLPQDFVLQHAFIKNKFVSELLIKYYKTQQSHSKCVFKMLLSLLCNVLLNNPNY